MIIPGYLDGWEPPFAESPMVDGSEIMASGLFWPAFLSTVGGSVSAPYAFGVDPADLDEVIEAFLDKHEWPVFSLRLAGTSRVHIVMRNFPDEGGVDYVLDLGDESRSIPLAAMEGHFRGPAIAWSELIVVAQHPDPDHTTAERFLLLLPVCADRDRPQTAAETVASALTAVGAESDVHQMSQELLDGPGLWTRDCPWATVDDTLTCSNPHAYRSIAASTPADLRLITEAFRPMPASGR